MKAKKSEESTTVQLIELQRGEAECYILGTTPIILNRMSQKVKQELLMPRGKMNSAEKASRLKHNPMQEFRDSPYTLPDGSPTLIAHLGVAFKKAIAAAALDVPGDAKKAQIGRLVYIAEERVPIYGIPELFMAVTRSADMNKTPDVRTRAIIPQWACKISVTYAMPTLNDKVIANLLAAAGLTNGAGDWRPQKGSGNYGQFKLVARDDPEWNQIANMGGRDAQIAAMENPSCYDDETAELLSWFDEELARRGKKAPVSLVA